MMRHQVESAPEERLSQNECHHYWLIETPRGRTSKGRCKFCGAEREFYNSWPYLMVGDGVVSPSQPIDSPDGEPDQELDDTEEMERPAPSTVATGD